MAISTQSNHRLRSQKRLERRIELTRRIDNDLILVWGQQKRIITGSDILGRLLRGISLKEG
jgi:hypothetical protein